MKRLVDNIISKEELKNMRFGSRKKPKHKESYIQSNCVDWFKFVYPEYLIFSVPNGGSRNLIEASHLKREGALAGVADLVLIARNRILFVEMKVPKNRQSPAQKQFESKVKFLGFKYVVCHSLDEFRAEVNLWLHE